MQHISSTTLVFLLLLLASSFLHEASAASEVCHSKCKVRCSKAGVWDRCFKYCLDCCDVCKECVPSGTYGNKDECPCYRDRVNRKGQSKCP
ncbi:Snakin-1 [Acorus gramineus]|uniref:Snakin-1 n=1 Tax=Acorus gramineus TaxID=55184 RepID=A0AAV9AUR2_ACOGR|nr:Snakin-1 [Acorus gramineus]